MGQCSTLPTEGRSDAPTSTNYNPAKDGSDKDSHMTTASSADNSQTPLTAHHVKRPNGYHQQVHTEKDPETQRTQKPATSQKPPRNTVSMKQSSAVILSPKQTQQRQNALSPSNQQSENQLNTPPPPDSSIRTRCYKLNLGSEYVGIHAGSTPRYEGQIFGPFLDEPPPLTYSASDDSTGSTDATSVAIKTAQIFRGITVSKDGTILTQNARATRSNRNNKVKRGEKSRQAAKIDKANDLVEESIAKAKNGDDKDKQMLSLVIFGEYDELKHLVRDGPKKLREATGLPDDNLLAVNRQRTHGPARTPMISSPSRKRVSPFALGSPHSTGHPKSPTSKQRHLTQSAPPKLKSHPRDPSRRGMEENRQGSRRGFNPMDHNCNNLLNNHAGESDWGTLGFSRGFNSIWNCGGNGGTISPTQHIKENKVYANNNPVSSRNDRAVVEQRHENNYRAVRASGRMEPPSSQRQAAVKG